MLTVDGVTHKTIKDAAPILKIGQKTLRRYIDRGIVSKPDVVIRGIQKTEIFTDEYLELAALQIEAYRESDKA